MAKQKSNKEEKEVKKKTRSKGTVKSASKESTTRKLTDDKPKPKSRPKPRPKPITEPEIETSSDTEKYLAQIDKTQTDKPADNLNKVNAGKSDTEISSEKVEHLHKDDQTGGATEAILETTEIEGLQAEEKSDSMIGEATVDPDANLNPIEKPGGTQTDEHSGEVHGSIVEGPGTTESTKEKLDDIRSDDQTDEPTELNARSSDTEIEVGEVDVSQTEEITDAILEAAAESERLAKVAERTGQGKEDSQEDIPVDGMSESTIEDSVAAQYTTESFPNEVKSVQTEGEQKSVVVGTEGIDTAESSGQDGEGVLIDRSEDVSEYVAENSVAGWDSKEKKDGTKDDGPPEGVDDMLTDQQESGVEDEVDESAETLTNHTGKADDTQTDSHVISLVEANIENDEASTAVYCKNKQNRTKKTGIVISIFIVTAAVIIFIFASVERRSAKNALVQTNKVAESIKQMQEETLKGREQVVYSQIESRELVIDSLLITRNGLELERANSDELEVKRIIDVFINDIDERTAKIKDDITRLRDKIKKAD
ncbi:parvulin-like peptidyl-prolyl isomerase [Candidatus Scalindua japonica]|uniref:Parvulin-like peptidyl-prolyl isomerase n=1 Tax=Candidatus Scalindua japonica TaxID=1284222 RepID=A0A286TWR9_9BACT|nr:hypothetical protein [Candidatus Scalindua japonica]GAX60339.1 parvulin-like peptidyl-prolyl isomerase [Candidatus Scalindua japonica]